MEVKITMLDVKDGDAIIIELQKEDKNLILMIDGGEGGYYKTKIKPKLQDILKSHNKKAPDIVVCTHYDSDHIGGLIPLIEDYISDIKEVWIHKIPVHLKRYIEKAIYMKEQRKRSVDYFTLPDFKNLFKSHQLSSKQLLEKETNLVIESLLQLERLINLIPASKLKQVYHKQKPLADWQEVTVLGPTKSYYDSLFPDKKTFGQFISEEVSESFANEKPELHLLEMTGKKACDILKKDAETKLTATNKASIIIAVDKRDKRYLFTGDAGIESFKSIPDWKTELKNLYFLKVPHHASDNNISKELIELMQPEYAYNTGCKYQNDAVLKCLSEKPRNKDVKTTKTSGDLYFDK